MSARGAPQATGLGVVGCGYIADSYAATLALHADALEIVAVHDWQPDRQEAFARVWGFRTSPDLASLLSDPRVEIVVNLTCPESHEEVTLAALAAGKHVYSEKPLAMTGAGAQRVADAARAAGRRLAGAPCNLLGEHIQTTWRAVREGLAGPIRLVYAEMDDGMIHRASYQDWGNRSGVPWPARAEFEIGCTFEHAGYTLSVLVAMFGPVRRVTAFSHLCIADKATTPPLPDPAPDMSVGCLEFDDGVVARMTNSVVSRYDHRLRLIGEEATIQLDEPWRYACRPRLIGTPTTRVARGLERRLGWTPSRALPLVRRPQFRPGRGMPQMDFMRGVRELADSIREDRPCRLSEELAVHVSEVTEVVQHPDRFDQPYHVRTSVPPIEPMPWGA